jgi:Cytochrome c
VSILKGELILNSHHAQEMPTWGPTLRPQNADGLMHLYSLVLYLAKIQIPVSQPGHELFSTLCAVCHGENGTGNGRGAPLLKTRTGRPHPVSPRQQRPIPDRTRFEPPQGDLVLRTNGIQVMPTWEPTFRTLGGG